MIKITATKTFENRTVLDIKDLCLHDGMKYALIGANGSGKSTLLKIIGGQLKPDSGTCEIDKDTRISYLPQTPYAFDMSIWRNILIASKNTRADKRQAYYFLAQLELTRLRRKNAARLSGGETQRVAIARTLMSNFDLLLLDEPTTALDVEQALAACELIDEQSQDKILIFATHSFKQAQSLADEIIFLSEGIIAEQCSAKEFFTAQHTPLLTEFLQSM